MKKNEKKSIIPIVIFLFVNIGVCMYFFYFKFVKTNLEEKTTDNYDKFKKHGNYETDT